MEVLVRETDGTGEALDEEGPEASEGRLSLMDDMRDDAEA